MTQHGTYADLLSLDNDINNWSTLSPAFSLFMRDRIKKFYQQNNLRLGIAREKINAIVEKYVVKKDDKFQKVLDDKGNFKSWEFISEDAEKQYKEEYDKFMEVTIEIHC